MKACVAVLVSILTVSVLTQESYAAPSFLGMCHKEWDCNATQSLYDGQGSLVFGWLENTFGRDCKCVDGLLQDARPKVVRAHLINSPCMRNKRCGRYEVLYKETAASASRKITRGDRRILNKFDVVLDRAAARIEKSTGGLQCYISPCLECDLYEPARRMLANRVSARLPSCGIVDNPYRRRCLRGAICEAHGESPRVAEPCIVDLDGVDGATIDVAKYAQSYRRCDIVYYWEPWMNCIRGEFVNPRSRSCKYGRRLFNSLKGTLCRYFFQSFATCSL